MRARAIACGLLTLAGTCLASMFGDPSVISIWQARGWGNNSYAIDRVGGAVGTNTASPIWRSDEWMFDKISNTQIRLGTATYLKPSGSWTFATAYMPTNFTTTRADILYGNQGALPYRGVLIVSTIDNRLQFQFYNGALREPQSAVAGVLSNSTGTIWYNIAVVCNGTNVSGWVNGEKVLSYNITAPIQYDGSQTYIGWSTPTNAPEGHISYVALWSRALTASEIGIQAAAGPYPQ